MARSGWARTKSISPSLAPSAGSRTSHETEWNASHSSASCRSSSPNTAEFGRRLDVFRLKGPRIHDRHREQTVPAPRPRPGVRCRSRSARRSGPSSTSGRRRGSRSPRLGLRAPSRPRRPRTDPARESSSCSRRVGCFGVEDRRGAELLQRTRRLKAHAPVAVVERGDSGASAPRSRTPPRARAPAARTAGSGSSIRRASGSRHQAGSGRSADRPSAAA